MKRQRNSLLLAGLAVGLIGVMILGLQFNSSGPQGRPSTHTSDPRGALALFRWLGSIGYNVERLQYQPFALSEAIDLLFLLEPLEPVSAEEAALIVEWVTAGGTLVLAESRPGNFSPSGALLRALDLELIDSANETQLLPVLQPVFSAPPATQASMRTNARVATERNDLAILVGDTLGPTLIGLQHGEGYVYLSSASSTFTNAGLGQADNAALVLNMLRRVPPGGQIRFDEIHHGFVREPSLRDLLLGSPWGWGIIYTLIVLAAYSVAGGRRFGRPQGLREETARRSSAEYVESMAGLFRRGRKADYILSHYRTDLKRRLARPYGINPQLEDDEFVRELALVRTDLDPMRVRHLLRRMAQPNPDDPTVLQLVAEADKLLTE